MNLSAPRSDRYRKRAVPCLHRPFHDADPPVLRRSAPFCTTEPQKKEHSVSCRAGLLAPGPSVRRTFPPSCRLPEKVRPRRAVACDEHGGPSVRGSPTPRHPNASPLPYSSRLQRRDRSRFSRDSLPARMQDPVTGTRARTSPKKRVQQGGIFSAYKTKKSPHMHCTCMCGDSVFNPQERTHPLPRRCALLYDYSPYHGSRVEGGCSLTPRCHKSTG